MRGERKRQRDREQERESFPKSQSIDVYFCLFVYFFFRLASFIIIIYLFILLYNIVLALPYINMHVPRVYMCSQSWTPPPTSLPSRIQEAWGWCTGKSNFLKYAQILLSPKHPKAAIRRNCVTRAQLFWEKGNIWLQPPLTLNIEKEKTQLQFYQAFLFQLKGGNKQNKTEKHLWRSIAWWHRLTRN